MSTVYLLRFRFTAPVHFGDAGEGGGLEEVRSFCHADTFFSALCREAALQGEAAVHRLYEKAAAGDLLISDLFPYKKKSADEYDFYLPRPVLTVQGVEKESHTLEEVRQSASVRKKMKKRTFIRASEMKQYLEDLLQGTQTISEEPVFGAFSDDIHFNGRTREPYSVGAYTFAKDAGVYLLVSLRSEEDLDWLLPLIYMLGLSGIGGRRSSGCGRFEIVDGEVGENLSELAKNGDAFFIPDAKYGFNDDDKALATLLEDTESVCQMALCPVLPAKDEIQVPVTGKLLRRGGFTFSRDIDSPVKTGSVHMMDTGSCFAERIQGRIADVSCGLIPHPAYKYGKGLFVGIKL